MVVVVGFLSDIFHKVFTACVGQECIGWEVQGRRNWVVSIDWLVGNREYLVVSSEW